MIAGEGDVADVRERFGVDDVEYVRFYGCLVAAAFPVLEMIDGVIYRAVHARRQLDGAQNLVIFSIH
jgi:hypothetical protein